MSRKTLWVSRQTLLPIFLCLCWFSFFPHKAFSQSPAGVSNNLQAWYKGEDVPVIFNNTSDWPSGTSTLPLPAIFRTSAATFYTIENNSTTNNEPFIVINDEYFETPLDINSNLALNDLTVFTVYKPNATGDIPIWGNGEAAPLLFNRARQVSTYELTTNSGSAAPTSYNHGPGTRSQADSAYIHYVNYQENGVTRVGVNGRVDIATSPTVTVETNAANYHQRLVFGNKRIGNDQDANISLAEFIVYSGNLAGNEVAKINSYLAIKYGIPITQNYLLANGMTAWNYSTGAGYNNNLVGIAYDNNSLLGNGNLFKHQSTSQRIGDYLTLSAPAGTGVGQYYEGNAIRSLIAGHNNGSISSTTAFDASNKFYDSGTRINRVWRVEQFGGYTNYSLLFDNNITALLPTGFLPGNMVVLVADNPNFTGDLEVYPLEYNGSTHTAQNMNFGIGSQSTRYFTIATLETALWVRGDAPDNLLLGSSLATLRDQSLSGNDLAGVAMPGTNTVPVLRNQNSTSIEMNFNPYVMLNQGTNNYLRKVGFIGFGKAESSVFMVAKHSGIGGGTGEALLSYATVDNTGSTRFGGDELLIRNPTSVAVRIASNTGISSGTDITNNLPTLITNEHGNNANNLIHINGRLASQANYAQTSVVNESGTLILGQRQNIMNDPSSYPPTNQLEGDLAELIICSDRLSVAEANKIRSYLAIKYGITLEHNYQDYTANVLWDRALNTDYNRGIAGIGRDDAFNLNQRKTRSQTTDAKVTIEHSGAFSGNQDFLLWGSLLNRPGTTSRPVYDSITTINAPTGYFMSERHWKVSNPSNRVGQVKVYMDIPNHTNMTLADARLLISNSPTFSTGFQTAVQPTNIGATQLEFDVTLQDGEYFTLGFTQLSSNPNTTPSIAMTNNEVGAPSTFEACAGDHVSFNYSNLSSHPVDVRFVRKGGGFVDVGNTAILFSGQSTTANGFDGTLVFEIPVNAVTGNVLFLDANGTVIFNSNAFITIHNEDLFMIQGAAPLCADQAVRLYGIPTGGFFSSSIPGLIGPSQDSLYGWQAGWGTNHMDNITATLTYNYVAQYTNGNNCPDTTTLSEPIVIRDNRLTQVQFATLTQQAAAAGTQLLSLDAGLSNMIVSTTPNILCNSNPANLITPCYPHFFSGAFVDQNNNFLSPLAGGRNLVQLEYNNGGCIGRASGFIDIQGALVIFNLPDTMCRTSVSRFSRDPSLVYSDTSFLTSSGNTKRVVTNQLLSTYTSNSNYSNAITPYSLTLGQEAYNFWADSLPNNVVQVVVNMQYQSLTTETNALGQTITISADTFVVIDTVNIIAGFATLSVGNFKSSYCANEAGDTLFPSLPFLGSSNTLYLLHNSSTGQDTILLPNNYLDPSTIYNSLPSRSGRDITLSLAYKAIYFGCRNEIPAANRPIITITAPLSPSFTGDSSHCQGDPPDTLRPAGATLGSFGIFSGSPAINPTTGVFSPTQAAVGPNLITYTLTDSNACTYSYMDTILVSVGPVIELFLDNTSSSAFTFCYDNNRVQIQDSIRANPNGNRRNPSIYWGARRSINNGRFDPSSLYANGDTTTVIWVQMEDRQGCFASDTAYITIGYPPMVDIDTFFNKVPGNYGSNNQYLSEHTYCQSSSSFLVDGFPSHTTGRANLNSIIGTGIGVNTVGGYEYIPSRVTNANADTVIFFYTDNNGCTNTDSAFIKVDPVPTVSITPLPNNNIVCANAAPVQLTFTSSTTNVGYFTGAGIDSSGLFNPALAGTGTHRLVCTSTGVSSCSSRDTINVTVEPVPTLSANYQRDYCENDPIDTLYSNNRGGTYSFSGSIIVPGTDLLDPSLAPSNGFSNSVDIYYSFTSANGCNAIDTYAINIDPAPSIIIRYLDSIYCANGAASIAEILPSGGSLISRDTAFVLNGRNLTFTPTHTDTGYTNVVYAYTDTRGCSNTATATTYVQPVDIPSIIGLDTFYCPVSNMVPISASIPGGYFTGSGIDSTASGSWFFVPSRAQVGPNNIQYIVPAGASGSGQGLTCQADTALSVYVSPALASNLISPVSNSLFCSTDTFARFVYDSISPFVSHNFYGDSNTVVIDNFFVRDTFYPNPLDSTFFVPYNRPISAPAFNPRAATIGSNFISYIIVDSSTGCKDSVQLTYTVNQYEEPKLFGLDSSYCEKDTAVIISASPGNSIITRDGVVLNPANPLDPILFQANGLGLPNNPLDTSIKDTVLCYYTTGACTDTARLIVDIHPVFNVNYTTTSTTNVLCLGGDTLHLTPNPLGGLFTGTGVRPGTDFFDPNLAEAGFHLIAYEYTDSITGCFSRYVDTFSVYGVPTLDFSIQGGCEGDTITFTPNNAILNLDNLFRNEYVDSVTGVWWKVEDTVTLYDSTGRRDSIASITHIYNNPGVYDIQLTVANQVYCIDSQTIRMVISPRVSSYPYVQNFEGGHGNWFAESRDSSYRTLWEWGIDSTIGNSNSINPNNNSNHLWSTQNNARYEGREQAWVYGPCFDLSVLNRPMISLDYWSDVRDSDGSVLEYQQPDGSWVPLGEIGRGINWFDDPFLTAQPGDQANYPVNPIGWGTKTRGWKNGRYKLDNLVTNNGQTRLRIAFAAVDVPVNTGEFFDGFAFDNVVVKNRNRNVLLETFANIGYQNMEAASEHSYQLVHHTDLNKDVVMLQYQVESPDQNDMFYLHNGALGRNRTYYYNGANAGQSLIDGERLGNASLTAELEEVDFEQDMLEDAKFSITIDTFFHVNGNFQIRATATALMNVDSARYRIYTVLSEDSLYYPNGSNYNKPIHAVARENDQYHTNPPLNTTHIFDTSWTPGQAETVTFDWNHAAQGFINYRPNCFHAVVFVQNIGTMEIFQVATTRDVSGYWVGVEPVEAEEELNELQSLNLFPNPAHDYFHLKFDHALEHEYQWKLVNIQGVEVKTGIIQAGTEQVLVDGLDAPAGTYVLLLHNDKVFVQRKVVLGRP